MILYDGKGNKIDVGGFPPPPTSIKGLKYYAWGDSITDFQSCKSRPQTYTGVDLQGIEHTDEPVIGYLGEIEDRYGCVCTNYGLGGHAAVGDYANLVAHDFADVALVTLAYGTNDARQDRAIGTVDSADFNTFAGALNGMLRKIYTDNPNCKVIVLTAPQRLTVNGVGSFTANGVGKTLEDYANMTRLVAARRSTLCIDIFHDSGINQVTLYKYSREGVHPLNEGYKRFSEMIIPAIDNLLLVQSDAFAKMAIPKTPPSADSEIINVPLPDSLFSKDGFEWNGTDGVTAKGNAKQTGKGIKLIGGKTYLYEYYSTYNALPERYLCVNDNENAISGSNTWGKGDSRGFSEPKKENIGGTDYYKWTCAIAVPSDKTYYIWPMRYNALGAESVSLRYY